MDVESYDYVIVGGGTAGLVVARRLAETGRSVAVLEAGPDDAGIDEVQRLERWQELLESEYDYDYSIEPQPRGNGAIRHARAKVLGGCSSHNSCIAFRPPDADFATWVREGAVTLDPASMDRSWQKVQAQVKFHKVSEQNPLNLAFLEACAAVGLPRADFRDTRTLESGADLFQLNAHGGYRQSTARAYLPGAPPSLRVVTGVQALKVLLERDKAVGVETTKGTFRAEAEVIVSGGAFDSPKLLMLSGIGPADELQESGVQPLLDLPQVGERLLDHPEGVLNLEARQEVPGPFEQYWEAGVFARSTLAQDRPDIMMHFGLQCFDLQTSNYGYARADAAFALTPNVCHARSAGKVSLRSSNPNDPPKIDFRYFTDGEGYDEQIMLEGLVLAREITHQPALKEWSKRELTPGAEVTDLDELSRYVRQTANTVYHPAGTLRMGNAASGAPVDPRFRVQGIERLRVVDASVFPSMTTVNPCIACMMLGERCAELISQQEN